jgi:ribosomal protein S2
MIKQKLKNNNTLLNLLFQSKNMYGELLSNSNKDILPFIFSIRNNYTIINLKNVSLFLKRIFKLIQYVTQNNKKILLIGNSLDINFLININFIKNKKNILCISNDLWIHGFITNKINKTKIDEKINAFLKTQQIELIFIFKSDINEQYLIQELNTVKIPIISIINTSSSLKHITYPIITNSKNVMSLYSIMYLLRKYF